MSNPWFRVYGEILHDRKVSKAARAAGVQKIEMIGALVGLFSLANDSPIPGALYVTLQERFSNEDVTNELEISPEKWQKIKSALIYYGMIEVIDDAIFVKNWSKRQFKSDSSTQRVQKHRQKMNNQGNETLQERFGNAPDTDTETESESELTQNPKTSSAYSSEFPDQIYQLVTNFIVIPSNERERSYPAFNAVYLKCGGNIEKAVDYCRPYYEAWKKRRTSAGKFYNPVGTGWAEWAANGIIPPETTNGSSAVLGGHQRGNKA